VIGTGYADVVLIKYPIRGISIEDMTTLFLFFCRVRKRRIPGLRNRLV